MVIRAQSSMTASSVRMELGKQLPTKSFSNPLTAVEVGIEALPNADVIAEKIGS